MPHRTKTDDPWDAISTSHLLLRAQQLASDRFTFLVRDTDITLRQYAVLTAIGEAPGASQSELARITSIDRSTLADLVQRLERNGLIERKEAENDARAHAVELTASGREMLEKTRLNARAADAAILDALAPSKRRPFRNMLVRLAKRADKLEREAEEAAKRQAKKEAKQRAKERKKAKEKNDAPSNDNPPRKPKQRRKAGAR